MVTGAGMVRAATTYRVPYIPEMFVKHSYGMMSVFSISSERNWEVFAEGLTEDGSRERLPMQRYFPMRQGFINEYIYNLWYRGDGQGNYNALAGKILLGELDRGQRWASVELVQETWPRSAEGYNTLRSGSGVTRLVLSVAIAPLINP